MWFDLSTVSGKHYQFKVKGFPTRYYHGKSQVFVSSLSELMRMITVYDHDIIVGDGRLMIYDDYVE